jgi:hypothetical protein
MFGGRCGSEAKRKRTSDDGMMTTYAAAVLDACPIKIVHATLAFFSEILIFEMMFDGQRHHDRPMISSLDTSPCSCSWTKKKPATI